jgi:Rieske 2Fe-2S family protein
MVSHSTQMLVELLGRMPNFSLPQNFYTSEDFYQLDLDHIFYREWLFVGHSCEIKKPGDFITAKIGAYPIIVTLGQDRVIRAFHNICRHRGQQLCTKEKGSGAKLVCPYHQWTYDLDGRLVFARDMMKEIDVKKFGLKPVHCEEMAGYIFISLADQPVPFAEFRAQAEPYMAPHNLADAKVAFTSTIIEKGNWKLVIENNRECYHCSSNHAELCRVYSDSPTLTGVDHVEEDNLIAAHARRCEEMGLPSQFKISDNGQYRTARIPFSNNAVSMTMSGLPAVNRRLGDYPSDDLGSMLLFHFPNTWNHLLADHALSFRILPISPTETEVTTKWLVHKDAVEGVDYDIKALTEMWLATNDQDRNIVEDNQKGILSPAYEPGPYSTLHEGGVIQFVDWYVRLITPRLKSVTRSNRNVA